MMELLRESVVNGVVGSLGATIALFIFHAIMK